MDVIPAIDLRDGRCVRLYQGDYAQETVFSEDPIQIAHRWVAQGASWLHLIDLDGAKTGRPMNLDVIEAIGKSVDVSLQVGGGIRSIHSVQRLLEIGVSRVILGTIAVQAPNMVDEICDVFGAQSVMVSIDARSQHVSVSGWTKDSDLTIKDVVIRMKEAGIQTFQYTDISRDGTLSEPNYPNIIKMNELTGGSLIAAGGISNLEHLIRLDKLGVSGAVIGMAIYTGDINFAEAIENLRKKDI